METIMTDHTPVDAPDIISNPVPTEVTESNTKVVSAIIEQKSVQQDAAATPETADRPAKDDVRNGKSAASEAEPGDENPPPRETAAPSEPQEKPPVWLCKVIVEHPKRTFGIFLSMHLGTVLLLAILTVAGYDAIPMNFQDAPFYLQTDWTHLRTQAWVYRDDDLDVILPSVLDVHDVAERTIRNEGIFTFYNGGKDNVFTPANLEAIKEAEKEIVETKGYEDFCHAYDDGTCVPPISILRFFDGSFAFVDPIFDDPNYENIPNVLAAAFDHPITKAVVQFHLGIDYEINNTAGVAYSPITRTLFSVGFPLAGFESPVKDEDKQEDKRDDFLGGKLTDVMLDLAGSKVGQMKFLFTSFSMTQAAIERTVLQDLALAMGSLAFIFIFVCFQTRSLFITALAVASIFTSFCATNLVYRIVFDYRYFGIFHVLSIFIILGIGADNIFVFYDTWRHTSFKKYPGLEYRLSDCYRRSASSMLITSLTTMIAFFANAVSPLLMISSFGLFSGLLICINYVSVITYFPCVVIIYHLNFEKWQWPCCRCCNKKSTLEPTSVQAISRNGVPNNDTVMTIDKSQQLQKQASKTSTVFNWDPTTQTVADGTNEQGQKPNIIVRFFAGPYFRFITNKIIRWIIVVLYLGMIAFFIYQATKLEVSKEALKIFKDDHNFARAQTLTLNNFVPSSEDDNLKVYIAWGLKEQDRDDCHKTDFACAGKTVWDESFDLNPPPAQLALLDFCDMLRNLPDDVIKKLRIRKNVEGEVEIKCFIENMQSYIQQAMGDMNISSDFALPTTATKVQELMGSRPDLYNMSVVTDRYYRYFEVALDYWLADGFKGRSYDYDEFYELIGMSMDADTNALTIDGTEYLYGTRLRYAAVVVNTTKSYWATGYEDGLPIMRDWEDFVQDAIEKMPPSLSGGVQFTPEQLDPDEWQWLKIQEVLVQSAWQGIGIGLGLALPIFIIATSNWILGVLATLNITIITFTIVGMINVLGWKLGALESLNMSLVVGLAIDYVVHLVEGYHFSTKEDRLGKTHDMLSEVGVSVVSGAFTTLGASFFMLFTVLMFFTQFGLFMFCTIGFSMVYSLGLFCTVLGIMGPEGDTGSIMPLYYWIKHSIIGRKKTDVDCQTCDGKGFGSNEKLAVPNHY